MIPDPLPTPGVLADGILSLVLVRFEPAVESPWGTPTYRFDVVRVADDRRVGHLNLRASDDDRLTRYVGQIGYGIDPPDRSHGHAARAVRLVMPFALACGLGPVWITCGPDNPASRRTLQNAGAEWVETVPVPADYPMPAGSDRRKCRYRIAARTPPTGPPGSDTAADGSAGRGLLMDPAKVGRTTIRVP